MYRYRLIDEATGADLGPLLSSRHLFEAGDILARGAAERYVLVSVVKPESDSFRAYLVVRGC